MRDIKIIGICVIKNEDIFIRQALKNIVNFCDKIIVLDNYSKDNTISIVKECIKEYPKISLKFFKKIEYSHSYIKKYVGQKKWIFGVDGDELYDPKGLAILRKRLLQGEFQKIWVIRGYFFHVVKFDNTQKRVWGYLAPPAKDPNKLFNFNLLKSWPSDKVQPIFHCQTHIFKDSRYSSQRKPKKKPFYKNYKWESCLFRCVHMRMVKRSTIDNYTSRLNRRLNLSDNIVHKRKYNERRKYRIGYKKSKDISDFLI